jgi:hypothetical protein
MPIQAKPSRSSSRPSDGGIVDTKSPTLSMPTLWWHKKTRYDHLFRAELEFGIVVVRSVPALRCSMCGADWIQDDIAARLELIVNEAKQKRLQVEVTTLA